MRPWLCYGSNKTACTANRKRERSELRAGVYIVVATPGRFIDHLQQGNSSLSRVSFVVLDEAGRMLDMDFGPQISEEYLTDPVRGKVGKVSSPTANVGQILEKVPEREKVSSHLFFYILGEAVLLFCFTNSRDVNQP